MAAKNGRSRTLSFGAINVTLPPPHEANTYQDLFTSAAQEKAEVGLAGDWVGLIGTAKVEDDPDVGPIVTGEFYKYVNLDASKDWFNVHLKKPAEPNELKNVNIPDALKPHFQFLPFVFFVRGHRLFAATKDGDDVMSIRKIEAILSKGLSTQAIKNKFGDVVVTVEPARETLQEILSMPYLKRLELVIKRPNPDDFDEFEQDFLDELESQRAKNIKVELFARDGEALEPSERTQWLAKIAQSNGWVEGFGGLRGKTKRLSTSRHPLEKKVTYQPNIQMRSEALLQAAKGAFNEMRN